MITVERLRSALSYDADTGEFRWLAHKIGRGCKQGGMAGRSTDKGYWRISVDGRTYRAHRLAWLYMTGCFPVDQVDHINGDKSDNRWCNLRAATASQNQSNKGIQSNNTSGFKGVSWDANRNAWSAKIKKNGKSLSLGRYQSKEAAASAYKSGAETLHGEFARWP